MKYTGKGFLIGVPARDLTKEEAEHFGVDKLLKSGCYIEAKETKPEEYSRRKSKRLEAVEPVTEE